MVYLLPRSSCQFIYFAPRLSRPGQLDTVFNLALINYVCPAGTPSQDIDFWLKPDQSCGCTSCLGVQVYHLKELCVST